MTDVQLDSYASSLLRYPKRKNRLWATVETRIGVLDYFALGDCELQQLVSRRNSGLGRVMPVSQRLLYEHRFVVMGEDCVESLASGGKGELARELEEIVRRKKKSLDRVYWNGTFGSPEFEKLFSLATRPLSFDEARESRSSVVRSLHYFVSLHAKLGHQAQEIDGKELERNYYHLQAERYGGKLLHSMDLLTFYLDGVSSALERRIESAPLCPLERLTDEGRSLQAIFRELYVPGIQPYVAQVHLRSRAWLEPTQLLALSLEAEIPPRFRPYYEKQIRLDRDEGIWTRFEKAIHRHAAAWQVFHDQCGLSVGGHRSPEKR